MNDIAWLALLAALPLMLAFVRLCEKA